MISLSGWVKRNYSKGLATPNEPTPPFLMGHLKAIGPRDPWRNREKKTHQAEDYQVQKNDSNLNSLYFPGESILIEVQDVKGESPEKESSESGKKTSLCICQIYRLPVFVYIYIYTSISLRVILLYLDSKVIKFTCRWPSGVETPKPHPVKHRKLTNSDLGIVERSHPSTRHWPQSVHYLSVKLGKK